MVIVLLVIVSNTLLLPVVVPKDVQALRSNVVAAVQLSKQLSAIVVHSGKVKVVAAVQALKHSDPAVVSFGILKITLLVQS